MPGDPNDVVKINCLINAFANEFNRVRPHRSLKSKTPEEFLRAASCHGQHGNVRSRNGHKRPARKCGTGNRSRSPPAASGTLRGSAETPMETSETNEYPAPRIEQEKSH